jgi:hypothetical protein
VVEVVVAVVTAGVGDRDTNKPVPVDRRTRVK